MSLVVLLAVSLSVRADVILQDHDIVTGIDPGSTTGGTGVYDPGVETFWDYINGTVTYTEDTYRSIPGDEQLQIEGGGFLNVLRYTFADNATGRSEAEPFIADLIANPVFAFDVERTAGASAFGDVKFRVDHTGTGGLGAADLATVSIANNGLGVQEVSFDLWNDSNFQSRWQSWTNGNGSGFRVELRTESSSSPGNEITTQFDNFRLVPEPASVTLLLLGAALAGLRRRMRGR